jgi:hypothetical protein
MKLSAYDAEVYEALRKPDIFADLYNGTVFQGEQVLRPEMLQYANEKEQLLAEDRMGNPAILYRIRDASRNCSLSDGLLRVVLNVEGQRSVHYGMPVLTLVFYYGEQQEWDGPVSLHEMLHFPEELNVKKDFFRTIKLTWSAVKQ